MYILAHCVHNIPELLRTTASVLRDRVPVCRVTPESVILQTKQTGPSDIQQRRAGLTYQQHPPSLKATPSFPLFAPNLWPQPRAWKPAIGPEELPRALFGSRAPLRLSAHAFCCTPDAPRRVSRLPRTPGMLPTVGMLHHFLKLASVSRNSLKKQAFPCCLMCSLCVTRFTDHHSVPYHFIHQISLQAS